MYITFRRQHEPAIFWEFHSIECRESVWTWMPQMRICGTCPMFVDVHVLLEMISMYPLVIQHSYGKSPFIEDFPIKHGDFP